MKTVYLGMSMDILHHGHINIEQAAKYGQLTVGLTDEVIAKNKSSFVKFDEKKRILQSIKVFMR